MRIVIDFNEKRAGGLIILRRRHLAAVAAAAAALLFAAAYALAHHIAAYWVAAGDARAAAIAERAVNARDADRRRLWRESIGELRGQIAAVNARLIELNLRGENLVAHLGLDGDAMFNGGETFACADKPAAESGDAAEDAAELSALLTRQNAALDSLAVQYAALREQAMRDAVLRDTIPMKRPVLGRSWLASGYGYRRDPFTGRRAFHAGADYAARRGTPVVAAAAGVVTFKGRRGNYGKTLQVYHGDGISSLYGHLHEYEAELWQYVPRGEIIAYVGSTGRSTGPHLHYEVRRDNRPRPVFRTIRELTKARGVL